MTHPFQRLQCTFRKSPDFVSCQNQTFNRSSRSYKDTASNFLQIIATQIDVIQVFHVRENSRRHSFNVILAHVEVHKKLQLAERLRENFDFVVGAIQRL